MLPGTHAPSTVDDALNGLEYTSEEDQGNRGQQDLSEALASTKAGVPVGLIKEPLWEIGGPRVEIAER
eukprot:12921048-Prorocentrum_lima.AAC.1